MLSNINFFVSIQSRYKPEKTEKIQSINMIENYINRLDRESYALIITNDKKDWEIYSIVFDNEGYLCFHYDESELYLVNQKLSDSELEQEVFIGEETVRPYKFFNDINDVLGVTKNYIQTGNLDENYNWEELE